MTYTWYTYAEVWTEKKICLKKASVTVLAILH